MKYSDFINIDTNFCRSSNILFDTNCNSYILSASSIQALRRIFVINTSNSIAITGPFGSGKSSLLIYLDTLFSKNKEYKVCANKLLKKDTEIYEQYQKLIGNKKKGFFSIKVISEHISFKKLFIDTLLKHKELKMTHKLIHSANNISFTLLLKTLHNEIIKLGYTGLLILIDELGKVIEYASEKYLDSDIHALQDLSEYVNRQNNAYLVVALHKSFKDYVQNTTHISFTQWDKIQGRFDNIVFQDDFYELMHIFEEAITINDMKSVKNIKDNISSIFNKYKDNLPNKRIPVDSKSLEKLAPLHPFSSLALFHIFSKHFQNQRSVFSFLSTQEPYSFQSFIDKDLDKQSLYTLDMLFDYINYISNAYTANMIDKESWKLAHEYLDSANTLTLPQQQIIKSISLISAFNLENLIQLDEATLCLALPNSINIQQEIKELESKGLILYRRVSRSYALIQETSININEELSRIIKNQIKIDYKEIINKTIEADVVLAKRFHIENGTAKFFNKEFIDTDITKSTKLKFKLIYVDSNILEKDILEASEKNKFSIYIPLSLTHTIKKLINLSLAINTLLNQKNILSNQRICSILQRMLNENKNEINKILDIKKTFIHSKKSIKYSSKNIQETMSQILQNAYPSMPIIINDLINPIQHETSVPNGMKKLFEHMINDANKKRLGIDKLPPQLAIYLSVIVKGNFHTLKSGKWTLSYPTNKSFLDIWDILSRYITFYKNISIDEVQKILTVEPYGLNEGTAKFILFVFLIINEPNIHFFRERTYQFDFDIDQIMDVWKNSKLYTINWYKLSKEEETIFAKYIQIFDKYFETDYTKKNIKYIFKKLNSRFMALPKYCHQTKNISNKAIALRSALIASKEPHLTFFELFPKALDYKNINEENIDIFIEDFKQAFNEIVFSYKKMALSVEKILAESFDLSSKHYPFENELETILEKYLNENEDKDVNAIYRACITSNDIVSFLNGLSLVLIHKKIDEAFDRNVYDLEKSISIFSNKVLSKLDIVEIINKRPVDVKKLKISTINGDKNLVMTVDNNKISNLSKKADNLLYDLKKTLTNDEQLYLVTLIAEKTIKEKDE